MYQKECGLTLKVRRLTIVGLLLCDIMTELTLTPKIKPVAIYILNDYFASVFVSEDCSMPTLDSNSFPDISPLLIHDEGVANLLSSLDDHKASGPDEIPTTLLKKLATVISPVLTRIFQASLHQCLIPMDWKSANVVPVFKKGERSIPSNYRPVSLTCICSKLLEHIIYSHIFLHLKKYDILCEEKHGFRANRSCETQLIPTVNDIAKNMDAGKQTDVILLDFSKAFDRVSHMWLCHKLHHLGINGSLLAWIKCYLSEQTQKVIVNGQKSSPSVVLVIWCAPGKCAGPTSIFMLH